MTGILAAAAVIAVPALAFTLWPLFRRSAGGVLPVPPDAREQWLEQKRGVVRSLRELEFEHGAGHVSDDDYAELRARYEAEAAAILTEIDRLGATDTGAETPRASVTEPRRSAWLHPAALAVSSALLIVFGIAIGVGIVRYTAPDETAGMPPAGSRPLAEVAPAPGTASGSGPAMPGSGESGEPRSVPPEVLKGMLDAARQALFAGQYGQAFSAYRAILQRDPSNVDALSHLGLVAAAADHPDEALKLFDRALGIDPNYALAHLYRGQVLYESKKDAAGAIRAWERFLASNPGAEDRERVTKLIAAARRGQPVGR